VECLVCVCRLIAGRKTCTAWKEICEERTLLHQMLIQRIMKVSPSTNPTMDLPPGGMTDQ
jgi:hypothetical protein